MKNFKGFSAKAVLSVFSFALMICAFSGAAFARFYCPLGYSYNPKIQLCVGKGSLKGYNTIPNTKLNSFNGKSHVYICPSKYTYSKKIQLCKGEGSLKGSTAQPTVKTLSPTAVAGPKIIKKNLDKTKKS